MKKGECRWYELITYKAECPEGEEDGEPSGMQGSSGEVSVAGSPDYWSPPPPWSGGLLTPGPCPTPSTTEGASPSHAGGGGVQTQSGAGGHHATWPLQGHLRAVGYSHCVASITKHRTPLRYYYTLYLPSNQYRWRGWRVDRSNIKYHNRLHVVILNCGDLTSVYWLTSHISQSQLCSKMIILRVKFIERK